MVLTLNIMIKLWLTVAIVVWTKCYWINDSNHDLSETLTISFNVHTSK